ncbi:uncharacterized protein RAG0_13763 [Rhynchosporium agropyri]|uniref:C2H2-type domain-containing protein n=1 Tax=Rhynchosporium agropyri TaxID=914238 RepID=A0A1E1LE28_9HELO|nr:uncharacterized protein RAG0_13763 [Rhynchosporium agropyri]
MSDRSPYSSSGTYNGNVTPKSSSSYQSQPPTPQLYRKLSHTTLLKTSRENASIPCSLCSRTSSSPKSLKEHIRTCHPESVKLPTCSFCSRTFRNKPLLEKHSEDCWYSRVQCRICKGRFERKEQERRHYWQTHIHQDVRSSASKGKKREPMSDVEYESNLHYFGLSR